MNKDWLGEIFVFLQSRVILRLQFFALLTAFCLIFIFSVSVFSQPQYDDRLISSVSVAFEGNDSDPSTAAQFELIAKNALGERYSVVRVRNALAALYRTNRIAFARVEAENVGANDINLRFVIRRKTEAKRVSVSVGSFTGRAV